MSYDLKSLARRVKRGSIRSLRTVLPKRAIANIGKAALMLGTALERDAFALISRRVELIERHLLRETDRARRREAMVALANRSMRNAVGKAIERRSSVLAERIVVLQRELDACRLVWSELSREFWTEKSRLAAVPEAFAEVRQSVAEVRRALEQSTTDASQVIGSIIARLDGLTDAIQGLNAGVPALVSSQRATEADLRELVDRHRATPYMTKPIFPAPPREPDAMGSFDYVGFEDIFRGPRSLVRDRQLAYLQFMHRGQRIVDLGSGRGEFLEIAREAGALAIGIDSNGEMVAQCVAQGLDARKGDALEYLRSVPAGSVDIVFSAQFIEHVAPDHLHALFVAARLALAPGGTLIAETVNPHSIEALKCFYVDLTHIKPLFPEVVLFFARSAGFIDGRIFYPTGDGFDERAPWNRGEYAIVATT